MASWFRRITPARVPTDIVVPFRYWDDTVVLKSIIVFHMSRYNAVLDPEKLHKSLERLLARKGWRKLGARLRKNTHGQIEYHIPAEFTDERPAVSFSQDRHDIPINEHPLASQLPEPSNRPAIVGEPEQFTSLIRPPGTPSSLDDYLTQDRGQLGLHIVSFTDATLVGLYFNHTTTDIMGWGALMTAWVHELHGRGDQIQTPVGGDPEDSEDFDPMRQLGLNPTEPHVLADRHMGTSGLVSFGLRNALDIGFRQKEGRIICVPGAFINRLRVQALDELKAEASKSGQGVESEPFVSHADIIAAWWIRLNVSLFIPADSMRTVTIQNAASSRKTLSSDFGTSTTPYTSNFFTMLYSLIPAREIHSRPVSWLAQEIRRAVVEQGTRDQVEAYFALQRQTPGRVLPIFGDSGMQLISISNWCKANLYGHDFSPARVDGVDEVPRCRSLVEAVQVPLAFPEGTLVMGQDHDGNYWMYAFRVKGTWGKVEQAFEEMDYTP
ncbi:hypothetical protein VP1G_08740 [Cytospora mali]|uniref:Uncharacterized protein n=1 Tax=Cytospora mali TaxID=578113 RepID=A0A194VC35_CYTMA|nr:hypothetical protein VP1G_08740 [Valsa mali var. pyri (nom. inval.)]